MVALVAKMVSFSAAFSGGGSQMPLLRPSPAPSRDRRGKQTPWGVKAEVKRSPGKMMEVSSGKAESRKSGLH